MFGSILKLNFRLLKVIEYCIFRSMILNVVNNLFCYFQNSRVPGLLVPGHVSHQEEDVVLRLVRLAQENVQGNHNYRSGQFLFWDFFIVNNFILGNISAILNLRYAGGGTQNVKFLYLRVHDYQMVENQCSICFPF